MKDKRSGALTLFFGGDSDDPEANQEVRVGKVVFAGEHLSDAFYGFINRAAESGRLAAGVVARRVAAGNHRIDSAVRRVRVEFPTRPAVARR